VIVFIRSVCENRAQRIEYRRPGRYSRRIGPWNWNGQEPIL
jgi:hypothetical protein